MLQFCFHLTVAAAVALAPATAAAADDFTVQTASGVTGAGPLLRLGEDWSVALGGEQPLHVAAGDLLTLRRRDAALPDYPQGMHLVLANGDHLPGSIQGLSAETLRFRAPCGDEREVKVPLSMVSLLWATAPDGTRYPDALRRRLAAGKRKRDAVYLRNGDVLEGIVNALDDTRLLLEVNRREVSVALRERVAVVAFSTDLVRTAKPKGPYAQVVLTNGARLSLANATADSRALKGRTFFGAEVAIPLTALAALNVRQGRAVYLSDLSPSRYEFTPYLDEHWAYVRDGSVLGRDLRLGGSTFDKGLGTHSESRLTYDLAGNYQWFEAVVGLDDRSGRAGNAAIEVWVDGKLQDLGEKAKLTAPGQPHVLRINVAGARNLALVTRFGQGGPVRDHVDWADARVVK